MATKKGTLRRVADAVGDAFQAVAAGVGLGAGPEPAEPKVNRKSSQKAAIKRAEEAKKVATIARRASHRRARP